jgi:hypothetical protein
MADEKYPLARSKKTHGNSIFKNLNTANTFPYNVCVPKLTVNIAGIYSWTVWYYIGGGYMLFLGWRAMSIDSNSLKKLLQKLTSLLGFEI